jgi:hypothetical protein
MLSDLVLNKGEIIVTLSGSSTGLEPYNGQDLNIGFVVAVCVTSDKTQEGDYVLFDSNGVIPFLIISGTPFYLLNENNVKLRELPT